MTPEKQRIAIATECGWHSFRDIRGDTATRLWGMPRGFLETSLPTELVPDYLNDLNAMREALLDCITNEDQWAEYWHTLDGLTGYKQAPWVIGMADAATQAGALLRTLGFWTTSP